ncbi:hypothetical protein L596_004599 [Steinernema carpocapsae]|uniref:Uncharacterized protein n=1 Tax=Steinernema carpocapsae TaxID=34508 RepID=A0A4U8UW98_STECR|nr:hypothetical protein L596_004599 [Steinernema carpocapsae]
MRGGVRLCEALPLARGPVSEAYFTSPTSVSAHKLYRQHDSCSSFLSCDRRRPPIKESGICFRATNPGVKPQIAARPCLLTLGASGATRANSAN